MLYYITSQFGLCSVSLWQVYQGGYLCTKSFPIVLAKHRRLHYIVSILEVLHFEMKKELLDFYIILYSEMFTNQNLGGNYEFLCYLTIWTGIQRSNWAFVFILLNIFQIQTVLDVLYFLKSYSYVFVLSWWATVICSGFVSWGIIFSYVNRGFMNQKMSVFVHHIWMFSQSHGVCLWQ